MAHPSRLGRVRNYAAVLAMPQNDYDEPDDEDWYDDEGEPNDDAAEPCPDCGQPIHRVADCCPACGYWLSDVDRRAMWAGENKPRWVQIAVALVLLMTIAGLVLMML